MVIITRVTAGFSMHASHSGAELTPCSYIKDSGKSTRTLGLVLKSYFLARAQDRKLARKSGKLTDWKEGELCQKQKDKPGERSVQQDVLRAALNVKPAARVEDLRVRYVARDERPREASAAQHARLPAVFDAQVAR